MPGGTSGEVRPTSSGSDAGAFAPGTKRRALPRWADSVTRFWNSFVGANGCSPEEVNGETASHSDQRLANGEFSFRHFVSRFFVLR